jgi:hypothetical protein
VLEGLRQSTNKQQVLRNSKHDAPTAWCIANEQRIFGNEQRAAAEEAARAEQAAACAAKYARNAARKEAARERVRARVAAIRLENNAVQCSSSEGDD